MDTVFKRRLIALAPRVIDFAKGAFHGSLIFWAMLLCVVFTRPAFAQAPDCAAQQAGACAAAGLPNSIFSCYTDRFTGQRTVGLNTIDCGDGTCWVAVQVVRSNGAENVVGWGQCTVNCSEPAGKVLGSGVSSRNDIAGETGCIGDCAVSFDDSGTASCFDGVCFKTINMVSKGLACGENDTQEPPDEEECKQGPDGLIFCATNEPKNCIEQHGIKKCYDFDEPPNCLQTPNAAICKHPRKPDQPNDLKPNVTVNIQNETPPNITTTTTITTYITNNNNNEEPPPPPPPPCDDPPCEEEEEPVDPGSASASTCGSFSCDADKTQGGRVMCEQLRVQWMHMCQLDGNVATTGGLCGGAPPTCSNVDRAQCAQTRLLHDIACGSKESWTDSPCDSGVPPQCKGSPIACASARQLWVQTCNATGDVAAIAGDPECLAPPQCGSGPLCASLLQDWSMRCAERATAQGGGDCQAAPTCTGNGFACLQLRLQWQAACRDAGEPQDGEGAREVVADALTDGNQEVPTPEGWAESGVDTVVVRDGASMLGGVTSAQGFLGGGACPVFPPVTVMGATLDLNAGGAWCTVLSLLRVMVLASAMFISIRILLAE